MQQLTDRQQSVINGLDKNKIAWMWRSELPKKYKIKHEIYHVVSAFDNNDYPVILNGSRKMLFYGYHSPHAAARESIYKRALKMFKFTIFQSDFNAKSKDSALRIKMFDDFRGRLFSKLCKNYPNSRYYPYNNSCSYLFGERIYEDVNIEICSELYKTLINVTTLNKLKEIQNEMERK
jgi:hypothetical protein